MKTYLTVASHWSVPGVRQYASTDRVQAEVKAVELVNELVADWGSSTDRHRDAGAPPPVQGALTWEPTLRALQLARLVDYLGGEGEANDALFEFCEFRCKGEPPVIGEGFTDELQELLGDYVQEDSCDPDGIGFPMVWIEEVENIECAEPSADLTLVLDMAERMLAEGEPADQGADAREPVEAAIARLRRTCLPVPSDRAPIAFALRNASGAISSLLHQVGQMRGMFNDEDGTIQDAVDSGEEAEIELDNVLTTLEAAEGNPVQPRIAVVCNGGVMQAVIGDAAVDVMLIDYDIECGSETYPMLEQEAGKSEPASVHVETAEIQPEWLDMVEEAVRRHEAVS